MSAPLVHSPLGAGRTAESQVRAVLLPAQAALGHSSRHPCEMAMEKCPAPLLVCHFPKRLVFGATACFSCSPFAQRGFSSMLLPHRSPKSSPFSSSWYPDRLDTPQTVIQLSSENESASALLSRKLTHAAEFAPWTLQQIIERSLVLKYRSVCS